MILFLRLASPSVAEGLPQVKLNIREGTVALFLWRIRRHS